MLRTVNKAVCSARRGVPEQGFSLVVGQGAEKK
jgi:hypothetical protein